MAKAADAIGINSQAISQWPRELPARFCVRHVQYAVHIKERVVHVVSFTQARSEFKGVIDRVVADCDVTLIHRRDGENAVLLSESTYNSMLETLHLLQSPANARRLMAAVEQDRKGAAKAQALIEE